MIGPSISVIIPTKGRPAALKEALRSVAIQTVPVKEVIVVDGTAEQIDPALLKASMGEVENPPNLIYLWAPHDTGLTAARNRGIEAAQGEIVQFMDDDTTIAPEYFYYLAEVFNSPDIGGAAGQLIDLSVHATALRRVLFRCFHVGPLRQRREELFLKPPSAITSTNTLPGASAYRRIVFDEFRFDEALRGPAIGEDLEFSYRVGRKWRMVIDPRSLIFHHRSLAERQTSRRVFADKISFYHYHFRKNLSGNVVDWLAYGWLNLGFTFDAIARLQMNPILGVLDGWRAISKRGLLARPPLIRDH